MALIKAGASNPAQQQELPEFPGLKKRRLRIVSIEDARKDLKSGG
jgi:hypothetical protein